MRGGGCAHRRYTYRVTRLERIRSRRNEILAAAAARGASNVRVFGSVARGTDDAVSDIDILVDLEAGRSLVQLGALQIELQELLGERVDLVTEAGLRERIRKGVLADAVPV